MTNLSLFKQSKSFSNVFHLNIHELSEEKLGTFEKHIRLKFLSGTLNG